MNKLTEKQNIDLYIFLREFKKNEYIIEDGDLGIINKILDFHELLMDSCFLYDGYPFMHQIQLMVTDLIKYYRNKDKPEAEKKKKCIRCRKMKPLSEYFGGRICRICKKYKTKRKYNKRKPL